MERVAAAGLAVCGGAVCDCWKVCFFMAFGAHAQRVDCKQ
jgi:hypothetical protein